MAPLLYLNIIYKVLNSYAKILSIFKYCFRNFIDNSCYRLREVYCIQIKISLKKLEVQGFRKVCQIWHCCQKNKCYVKISCKTT